MVLIRSELLIEVNHILKNDFLLILKGFAISVLIIISIESLSDHDSDVISDLSPEILIDLGSIGNIFE